MTLPALAVSIVLAHVRVIDGTGSPAKADQTIVIDRDRIQAVGPSAKVAIPAGAEVIDLTGRTVMPGLVGMHDHLFYQIEAGGSTSVIAAPWAFARLYLASGVTTIRTAGTADFDGDARLKRRIDAGSEIGPTIHLTGPYLNATTASPDPEGIARQVAAFAERGATSFKAYTSLRGAELEAAIRTAHERGLAVTGHLCAVGFRQAASLGIDNLEHGLAVDTELYSGKRPDECPDWSAALGEFMYTDTGAAAVRQTIDALVRHGVRVTSTLAVFESYATGDFDARIPTLLARSVRGQYEAALAARTDAESSGRRRWALVLQREMAFERAFVKAGGRLIAGADPTGWGGVVAGFGDLRGLELLVEAGFTTEQAIEIATSNGARFLGEQTIGSIAPGMQADLVVVRGDPVRNIADVRKIDRVYKNGVGYDPAELIASVEGTVGSLDFTRLLRWPANAILGVCIALACARVMRGRRGRNAIATATTPLPVR